MIATIDLELEIVNKPHVLIHNRISKIDEFILFWKIVSAFGCCSEVCGFACWVDESNIRTFFPCIYFGKMLKNC